MDGIKFAATVVGITLVGCAAVAGIVFGCLALFGNPVGGFVALGVCILGMGAVIAIAENMR